MGSIPISERTYTVENNIHRDINRFTELREQFSTNIGNGLAIKNIPKNNRPIFDNIKSMTDLPYWLMPIANNKKKINIENSDDTCLMKYYHIHILILLNH